MSPTLKSTGVGHFGPKFRGVPLRADRHVGVAKSEHPRLTNGEINFEEFQPMSTNVTDRRTDRQTTCDRNTALCTKVHRAVKTVEVRITKFSPPRVEIKICSMSRAGAKGEGARTRGHPPRAVLSLTADVWDDCGKLMKDDVG